MSTWVIASSSPEISTLLAQAGIEVNLLVVGNAELLDSLRNAPVAKILYVPGVEIPESYAAAISDYLEEVGADTVLAADFPSERTLAAAATAKLGGVWISSALTWDNARRQATRLVAARAEETLAISGPVGLVLESAGIPDGGQAEVSELALTPRAGITLQKESARPSNSENLADAARVIGVGRGIGEKADLEMITTLATALDAKVGATRPLAEGYGWFDSYIGLTGQTVHADLYMAIGISGQIHHTGGVQDSAVVVAINDDPQAPIFAEADYGIVGDLYEVVPALQAALEA